MSSLLLAPHNDDETLFAAYTCIREKPRVVIVTRSDTNGEDRMWETHDAIKTLGCTWEQWGYSDKTPAWGSVRADLERIEHEYAQVFAPWPEPNGHPQHNEVGVLATEVFGPDRVTHYTTYRYGGPRSTGIPVQPEPEWILLKLRALACYRSQILNGPRRFFTHALDEWYAP